MNNDIDALSLPVPQEETRFAILFEMPVRESKEKPGRILEVAWDKRFPLVEGMEGGYVNVVRITSGARPGNHYHKKKREIYFVLHGDVEVFLEDIVTKKRERYFLSSIKSQALYIKPGFAHVVVPCTRRVVLLVVTDSPNSDGDEFAYEVVRQNLIDTD